ncbi:sensor histidine kinase [Paracraurococcus lichenis]|uniref:histidine kinase n=1 Tax=Paracraurococcus lichenis TaxID=3064888 RepID=A0ABT9E017_9PROT|nr:PAS domain-containing protein [Paracraurococcus sp. LOR1-02]MDO9709507.1 PAS domain-containing protein [Paracraurococcus sp. LOR1-02]
MTFVVPARPPATIDLAVDLAPVPTLLLLRDDLEFLAGNAAAAALLGCDREALAGRWEALLADAALRLPLARAAAGRGPDLFEASLPMGSKPPRPIRWQARRVELDGRRLLSVGLLDPPAPAPDRDLADRRLEVALAGAELGAWHRDLRTDHLEVTERWCEMLGLPPRRIVPMTAWQRLVHPEDRARLRRHMEAHIAGADGRFELEMRLRHADGRWIPVLSRGQVIERDAAGRALVVTGTHLDLTTQRAAEAARLASEREARRRLAELETLYHFAPLGLAQFDRDLRFVRINEALAEINGFPVEAHIGRNAWDLVPDLRNAAEPLLRRVLAQGETITGIEFTGETAKAPGVKRDWVEQFYPLRDPETQEVVGVGVVCEEVTERKRAERARELLLRELDHRVKNLFAIVRGLVSFSARGADTPAGMRDLLIGRIGALARAHDLVRPAIADDGGGVPATTLTAMLGALLDPFAGEGLRERIALDGPPVPLGSFAAPPLMLALHELATNAAKYGALSREHGRVAIDWTEADGTLRLRWSEAGGPAVAPPERKGFGHRLITQSAAQLGGSARFAWHPDGLRVELLLPRARLGA